MNVFLCFSVITIHLTADPVLYLRKDSIWYFIFFIINKSLSFAVPGFIFLSGFKLYNKYQNNKIDLKKFYEGRIQKIIFPYFIAYLIYFTFYRIMNVPNNTNFFSGLLLGTLTAHFYYIIIAVQFYLIFPLLNYLFNKCDKFILIFSFIATLIFAQFLIFNYSDRLFITYIFYFVFGMYIAKYYSQKQLDYIKVFAIIFVLILIAHIYLSYKMSLGFVWYKLSSIGQVVYVSLAIAILYYICNKIKNKKIEQITNFINPYTFNIFLYHILIMNIMHWCVFPNFNLSLKDKFIVNTMTILISIFSYCSIKNNIKKTRE